MNVWYNISDNVEYKSKLLIILHNHLEETEVSNFLECNGLEKKWNQKLAIIFYRCLEQHISLMCKPTKTYRK